MSEEAVDVDMLSRPPIGVVFGILSAGLMAFQAVWIIYSAFKTLRGNWSGIETYVGFWPTVVAFPLSCFSLVAIGLSRRNAAGVVGFIFSLVPLAIWTIIRFHLVRP